MFLKSVFIMDFKTSQISITSRAQQLCSNCHDDPTKSRPLNAVISRVAALLLSPAATLDFAIHAIALPFSIVYAVGKSIYQRELDFVLPWQHLQRIREAVFPILFGTIFGLLHPYLGIYATEPKVKHVVGGYLLSNSSQGIDVVISPLAAYRETVSNLKDLGLSGEYQKIMKGLIKWEESLEKIQSFEMFCPKITHAAMGKIYQYIDSSLMPFLLKEIISRIAVIAYPIFAAIDLTGAALVSTFFFVTGVAQLVGGKSPAYLETTSSPILHIYHLAKIIIGAIGVTAGFFVSLVSPKCGLKFSHPSSKTLGVVSFLLRIQFLKLSRQINALKDNERLLLPIVVQNNTNIDSELDLLPSHSAHMTYLLIEKENEKFSAELIDRGCFHGARYNLTNKEVLEIAKNALSLRFSSTNEDLDSFLATTFSETRGLIDLGQQGSVKNCIITNLFAVFEVMHSRDSASEKMQQVNLRDFKLQQMKKYDYFQYDFFPYVPMKTVIEEIERLEEKDI